jgi:hydroxymethylbilane synthase
MLNHLQKKKWRLITRRSPLALWQASEVKKAIEEQDPSVHVLLHPVETVGDRLLVGDNHHFGSGKGLFVKALEQALLDNNADLAAHSLKDLERIPPPGLKNIAYLEGASPYDVLVAKKVPLKKGARVGTSSQRRAFQLKAWRSDLEILPIRGNLGTRLQKWRDGMVDALVLAEAGLERLGWSDVIVHRFSAEEMVPAMGQGVIAVQIRQEDPVLGNSLAGLNHGETVKRIWIEQAINQVVKGGCSLPIGIFAQLTGSIWTVRARALSDQGGIVSVRDSFTEREQIKKEDYQQWGQGIGQELRALMDAKA